MEVSPVGLCLLKGVIVLPQYRVPDEAAGTRLSGQAPCVRPGARQKPVDDVAVCGKFRSRGPGLRHKVRLVTGKSAPSRHTRIARIA